MHSIPQETLDVRQIRLSDACLGRMNCPSTSAHYREEQAFLILDTHHGSSIEIPIDNALRNKLATEIALARLPPRKALCKEPRK